MDSLLTYYCRLCQSANTQLLFFKRGLPYYKCSDCRFVFSDPEINSNLSNKIIDFEPAYLDYFNEKRNDKRNHLALVKLLKKHKDLSGSRILDVGCGSGKFVKYLRKEGYLAYGLEPSIAVYDHFLKNNSFYFRGFVSEYALLHTYDKFDLIIVSDVIEHIDKPAPFIENISTMLSPEGILFISTPDTKSLLGRISGKNWHYYNKYHLSLFSISNLTQLATNHHLSKIASGHVSRYQSLYYIVSYLMNFMFHKRYPIPLFLAQVNFRVNLFDNMYVIYKKQLNRT